MNARVRLVLRIASAVLLIGLLGSAGRLGNAPAAGAARAAGVVPGQFIAKIHTEALGRMPTQAEWQSWVVTFTNSPDCEQTVRETIQRFYTSADFFQRYPDEGAGRERAAQLLALSRGTLNQEIDQGAFNTYMSGDWPAQPFAVTMADLLYANPKWASLFSSIVHDICDVGDDPPWYTNAPYYWRNLPVVIPPAAGPYATNPWVFCGAACGQTGVDLQWLLYNAGDTPSKTVYLAPGAVVRITDTLTIPAGITLTTWHEENSPPLTPDRYALMGRLVRASRFDRAMVLLQSCSTLQGVWVDGQKKQLETLTSAATNVVIQDIGDRPACQTRLLANRLTDPLGWTQVLVLGQAETGQPCGDVYIGHNLLTGYANSHRPQKQAADGLSIACGHTTAEDNQLVDITDVGVVVFRAGEAQRTVVRNNMILNAGNSAFGALIADPIAGNAATMYDFSGTVFLGNVIWTSPQAHIDAVLVLGTRVWNFEAPEHNLGTGATFLRNTTGDRGVCPSCTVRTNNPVIVSGMLEARVQDNNLRVEIENTILCPYPGMHEGEHLILADADTRWASFREPKPLFTAVVLQECVSHVAVSAKPPFLPLPWPARPSWAYLPALYRSVPQACTDVLVNGGFEAGLAPAVESSASSWPIVCDWANRHNACRPDGGTHDVGLRGAHTGTWAAWLGGYNRADDVLSLTVSLPPDFTAATLSFWRYVATTDQQGDPDPLSVQLRDSAGRLIAEAGTLDNWSQQQERWWQESWDVSAYLVPYQGQQIWLRFQATTDGDGHNTSFFVDDVSLSLCAPAVPGNTPPPPSPTPAGSYPPLSPGSPLPTPEGRYPPPP